ncbi:MAG: DUF6152 family protein [Terriglobia bacterium]
MKPSHSTLFLSLSAGLLAGCWMAGAALAHHGWTGYDASKTLNLTGVITQAEYTNPHGMIRVQGGDNGKTWVAVLAPPSRMSSRGLTPEMLKVGATVTVVGYPHSQKGEEMRAERITIAGKTVELR